MKSSDVEAAEEEEEGLTGANLPAGYVDWRLPCARQARQIGLKGSRQSMAAAVARASARQPAKKVKADSAPSCDQFFTPTARRGYILEFANRAPRLLQRRAMCDII